MGMGMGMGMSKVEYLFEYRVPWTTPERNVE